MLFHFLFGIMVIELTPAFQSSAETMETRLAPRNRPETRSTALCKFCLETYINITYSIWSIISSFLWPWSSWIVRLVGDRMDYIGYSGLISLPCLLTRSLHVRIHHMQQQI